MSSLVLRTTALIATANAIRARALQVLKGRLYDQVWVEIGICGFVDAVDVVVPRAAIIAVRRHPEIKLASGEDGEEAVGTLSGDGLDPKDHSYIGRKREQMFFFYSFFRPASYIIARAQMLVTKNLTRIGPRMLVEQDHT